ncbi:MAG TPA: hypothetical protein VGH91_04405 [Gammaproteobacteria bacterium]|jgi:hypothetical protein
MALTFTQEDKEWMEDAMSRAVGSGLSAIGLGYDNEEGKKAIRADQEWTRQQRVRGEERASTFRRGLMSALAMAAAGGILYLSLHLHDFGTYLVRLSEGNHP